MGRVAACSCTCYKPNPSRSSGGTGTRWRASPAARCPHLVSIWVCQDHHLHRGLARRVQADQRRQHGVPTSQHLILQGGIGRGGSTQAGMQACEHDDALATVQQRQRRQYQKYDISRPPPAAA